MRCLSRDLRSWNVHRKLRLALAVGCANHERSLARRTVRVHTDNRRLCADGRTLRPLFTFLTFLAFLARRPGFTFVAFLAFLARRPVFTDETLESLRTLGADRPGYSWYPRDALDALSTRGSFFAGFAGLSGRSVFTVDARCSRGPGFSGSSVFTDEPLKSLRTLGTYGTCDSGYSRNARETLRTSGSVCTGAVGACRSLWSRHALRTRFAPQLLEHLWTDLFGAPDDVAGVARRGCRTGKPKDNEGTGCDESGYALHSSALFYGPLGVIWETSHYSQC